MPTLAVLFAHGAVTPAEALLGLDFCGDPVFLVGPDCADRVVRAFQAAGRVRPLDLPSIEAVRPDGILTFSDRLLPLAAAAAGALGLPFHSGQTVRRLTDKYAQRECLLRAGVDPVRCVPLGRPDRWAAAVVTVGLPAVVKPAHGEASRNTYLVSDAAEGGRLVARLLNGVENQLVVEEYLAGTDYVSVESLCDGETIHHIGVTGKLPMEPPFRETGQFYPSTVDETGVLDLVGRALRALGVRHGITHAEVKLTPSGPRLIEVNGRIGGYLAELYRRALGTDLVTLAGRLALGERVTPPARPRPGVHFQYYTQPPVDASALLDGPGPGDLADCPGVLGYTRFVAPGAALPGDRRSFDLDLITGHGATHEEMLSILDVCLPRLAYTFQTPAGPRTVRGSRSLGPEEARMPTGGRPG